MRSHEGIPIRDNGRRAQVIDGETYQEVIIDCKSVTFIDGLNRFLPRKLSV